MSLYYVEESSGAWHWVEAATPRDAAEQIAGSAYIVGPETVPSSSAYPVTRYCVHLIAGHDAPGHVVNRLDVTEERFLMGAVEDEA